MSTIKNVAICGASGSLGSVIFKRLVDSDNFNVRVLRRTGSSSTFPVGTDVVDVDFTSVVSLKNALSGQDAVVSSMSTPNIEDHLRLIDAAIAACVPRIIPSEFGSDLDNANTRKLPPQILKAKVHDYVIEKSKVFDLTYTFIYNSAFLDWGLKHDFLLKVSDYKPIIFDGGDLPFSATTLGTVADGVIGVLLHPEETENRAVRIHDTILTQNKLLALALKVAPNKPWDPVLVKLDDCIARSDARLKEGLLDMETFFPYLIRSVMDPAYESEFKMTDNVLLGLNGLTDKEVEEIVKVYVK